MPERIKIDDSAQSFCFYELLGRSVVRGEHNVLARKTHALCEYELGFLSVWDLADPDKNGSDEYREEHGPMVRVPAWAEELEDELERRYPEVQDLTARQVLNALLGLQMEKVL